MNPNYLCNNSSIAVRVTQLTNFTHKASDDVAYPCQGRSDFRIISKRTALSADCGQVPSPSELSSGPASLAFFWTTSVSETAPCLSYYSTCWWYVRFTHNLSINKINFNLNLNHRENSNLQLLGARNFSYNPKLFSKSLFAFESQPFGSQLSL